MFVPAHAMAVLALGLLIGQQATWTRLAALSFMLGLAAGLGVMTLGIVPTRMNELVLGGALIAGLLAALARPLPEALGCVLAVLLGFCIALNSPPEAISLAEANLMLIGTGLGAVGAADRCDCDRVPPQGRLAAHRRTHPRLMDRGQRDPGAGAALRALGLRTQPAPPALARRTCSRLLAICSIAFASTCGSCAPEIAATPPMMKVGTPSMPASLAELAACSTTIDVGVARQLLAHRVGVHADSRRRPSPARRGRRGRRLR